MVVVERKAGGSLRRSNKHFRSGSLLSHDPSRDPSNEPKARYFGSVCSFSTGRPNLPACPFQVVLSFMIFLFLHRMSFHLRRRGLVTQSDISGLSLSRHQQEILPSNLPTLCSWHCDSTELQQTCHQESSGNHSSRVRYRSAYMGPYDNK